MRRGGNTETARAEHWKTQPGCPEQSDESDLRSVRRRHRGRRLAALRLLTSLAKGLLLRALLAQAPPPFSCRDLVRRDHRVVCRSRRDHGGSGALDARRVDDDQYWFDVPVHRGDGVAARTRPRLRRPAAGLAGVQDLPRSRTPHRRVPVFGRGLRNQSMALQRTRLDGAANPALSASGTREDSFISGARSTTVNKATPPAAPTACDTLLGCAGRWLRGRRRRFRSSRRA
jgi:hypothetical protein